MKRVCVIIYNLGVGGAEQVAVAEVQEFVRRGFAVSLVTLSPDRPNSLMFDVPDECEKVMIEFRSLYDWRSLRALARLLRQMQPDIIITQMWFANTVGRIAARWARIEDRLLAFEQNVYDKLRLKSWKQFLADRLLQRWCRKVVAVSYAIKESLLRSHIDAKRVVVIHDSIDLERVVQAPPAASIRAELGVGDAFMYLFVGRLVPQKGVDVLIAAFAKQSSGVLLIAGQGVDRASLEAQAAELGVASRVFFLGVRRDVPSLMKVADCFVLASRLEGLGMVLVEAIMSGLPVVATNVDGIPEVVEDGKTGELVAPDDIGAFAAAMQKAREDKARDESIRAYGREQMQKLFSIQAHVDAILACF